MTRPADRALPRRRPEGDDRDLEGVAPRDSHWHHTMVQPRFLGLFDLRASLALLFCFINIFEWWHTKLAVLAVTVVVFTALEARRMTPEVAVRRVVAWLRGPVVPGIATRSQTALPAVGPWQKRSMAHENR